MLDSDAERFGAIVNQLRLQRGWSLAHLAKITGMNAIHLGVLERGENVPSLTTILRVADALGVAPAELVHRVDLARHAARAKKVAPIQVTYEIPGADGGRSTE
jgi:transcriptional regulator with XRE-family HTH domain